MGLSDQWTRVKTDSDERVAKDRSGDVTDPHACETGHAHVGEEY